ncbi:MAG: acetyl-CoA carboxylase biotin carboxylase subunit, partial [Alphaproteobacteria bacterium]
MFDKILIANRGEIARRVIRTARRLGIATVAVYSEADSRARHVVEADEAYLVGPAPARESYLDADAILAAARRGGADAIHPGYGFLSENADFAEACAQAGRVFIGPPPSAIRAMGSKSAAKTLMGAAGVPLVPGYHGEAQDLETLTAAADEIGYPVLVKASAGGGGRGMRIVADRSELAAAVESARREAASAFGDDQLLLEKFLESPRHIEVQIFADSQGEVVHLFERDCSVQRRYQKVIEEAPAPGMGDERRAEMGAAAVAAAAAIGYVGAGTVEFIAQATGKFYFMEMNTRLQVEHPVTEMITGQDLVEWQLLIAAGAPLPLRQGDLIRRGHAIEARLYAEDPGRDFLPATGRLAHLRLPADDAHTRVDSGVVQGDEVSPHYDPMLAKLIVWDTDRAAALRRLRAALARVEVAGVATNAAFLAAVAAHPAFAAGGVDTGFIARHGADLIPDALPAGDEVLALASLGLLLEQDRDRRAAVAASSDPYSPWALATGWRLNGDGSGALRFRDGEAEIEVGIVYRPAGYALDLPGGPVEVRGELDGEGGLISDIGGARIV